VRNFKKSARILGAFLTVFAIGYAVYLISKDAPRLKEDFSNLRFIGLIGAASFLYACLGPLLALAWMMLLRTFGPHRLPFRLVLRIYGTSQILKYVPTNVLHVVRRHVETRAAGADHLTLVWASFLEGLLLVCAAAGVTALFAAPLLDRVFQVASSGSLSVYAILSGAIAGGILLALVARRLSKEFQNLKWRFLISAIEALVLYASFFLLNGFILSFLAIGSGYGTLSHIPYITGLVAAAWVAGFLTPGAPGGIGIREVILINGLQPLGYGTAGASIAVAYRIVTVLGDCGFAFGSSLAKAPSTEGRALLDKGP
jgi:uncharacterized membrane protein YbhN (UPF0104 family)